MMKYNYKGMDYEIQEPFSERDGNGDTLLSANKWIIIGTLTLCIVLFILMLITPPPWGVNG